MAKTTPYVPGRIKKAVTFEEKQKRGKRKAQKKQEGIILKKTDELRVGKFRVEWVVNGLEKKLQYQWREMGSPPLRTSLFPLAGKRRFQLKFWPDGCGASRDGYCALMLHYPENFGALTNDINLFVGDTKKGPFKYRSPEYWKAAMSMCRLENEELKGDRIVVGVEIAMDKKGRGLDSRADRPLSLEDDELAEAGLEDDDDDEDEDEDDEFD